MEQQTNLEYWNKRAIEIKDDDLVTHRDLFQKKLELDLIASHLEPTAHVLEVGCGNGFATEFLSDRVAQVDAFDISEAMVNRAKKRLLKNCRLFVKKLPNPSGEGLELQYDVVLSIRVLINLPNWESQAKAIEWIASKLKIGGKFLLLEGSQDGLESLNLLRESVELSAIREASHNVNIRKDRLMDVAARHFEVIPERNIGTYDFLTRFYYPLLVGENNVKYNTEYHEAAFLTASKINVESLSSLSRLHVYTFVKREEEI